jgi:lipopolysaccharide export system protein LptA
MSLVSTSMPAGAVKAAMMGRNDARGQQRRLVGQGVDDGGDLIKQVVVFNGNVVVAQGTLADPRRPVELRERPRATACATGHRQRRQAGQLPPEARRRATRPWKARPSASTTTAAPARCASKAMAVVRRLRGSTVADEIQGHQIVWDSTAEIFNVRGGAAGASNPGGRVRAVITPRAPADDATDAAPAASGTLKPSPGLGDRR